MLKSVFFWFLFAWIIALAVLHALGLQNFLYWEYWWYDILTHFMGGFWVGGIWSWVRLSRRRVEPLQKKVRFYVSTLVLVFVVAGVWEIFEYLGGMVDRSYERYLEDTITDIIVGTAGAFVATWLVASRFLRDRNLN